MIAIFKNRFFLIFSIIAGALLIIVMVTEGIGYYMLAQKRTSWMKSNSSEINPDDNSSKELEKQNENLVKKIKKLSPTGFYIIVDTAKNTLYLKKDNEIIRKAVVATGNGNVLAEPSGKKKPWIFDTPRGEFAVKYKINKPTWIKPDWAFIEEGEEIPKTLADRAEADVMGEYALGFGKGFFIHGTLYTRLLGRNATHGCVRVGDDDLLAVNKASIVGTKIFIY